MLHTLKLWITFNLGFICSGQYLFIFLFPQKFLTKDLTDTYLQISWIFIHSILSCIGKTYQRFPRSIYSRYLGRYSEFHGFYTFVIIQIKSVEGPKILKLTDGRTGPGGRLMVILKYHPHHPPFPLSIHLFIEASDSIVRVFKCDFIWISYI